MKSEKLTLKKDTVRKLNEEKLNHIAGGGRDISAAPPTRGSIGNNCPCCAIPVTD